MRLTHITLLEVPPRTAHTAAPKGTLVIFQKLPDQPKNMHWMYCPNCGRAASLTGHEVNIIDGKATLAPSLICPSEDCKAHYYVRGNEIQWL